MATFAISCADRFTSSYNQELGSWYFTFWYLTCQQSDEEERVLVFLNKLDPSSWIVMGSVRYIIQMYIPNLEYL